jgi:hypothetical protein
MLMALFIVQNFSAYNSSLKQFPPVASLNTIGGHFLSDWKNIFQIVFDDALDISGGPIRGIAQDHSSGLVNCNFYL